MSPHPQFGILEEDRGTKRVQLQADNSEESVRGKKRARTEVQEDAGRSDDRGSNNVAPEEISKVPQEHELELYQSTTERAPSPQLNPDNEGKKHTKRRVTVGKTLLVLEGGKFKLIRAESNETPTNNWGSKGQVQELRKTAIIDETEVINRSREGKHELKTDSEGDHKTKGICTEEDHAKVDPKPPTEEG